ncbi:MAG: succinyl-diaminopimelate desuccinylase [Acidocella sp. 20-57-95]|nr:MAG: succinyl-diaminopimelate desuccinylase [Acidocella sp. 20-57-95]OYV62353.1 MAG: succinyl-diaminopimelate desuccinylase [Acidocella sp. 21-58-7]HQT65372.1 succinyl-diaminopimelate desuccinylase [Acidocella sp.]
MIDPLPLAQALLRCPSVTPLDAGAQDLLAAALTALGFSVTRLKFGEIENLFAERGTKGRHLCFAGHTDVVPPGSAAWRHKPFGGDVDGGVLYGRGACDMKGAITAFVAAAAQTDASQKLSLLITGDEEGEALDGTVKVLDWMKSHGKIPDFCIVGEPTSKVKLGDVVKIGRRGSLNAVITVNGRQGHAAYPHLADNPVHKLVPALAAMAAHKLDAGTKWFEPSCLQITSVDVGNQAHNVIPAQATAKLNIRFNDLHNEASLSDWLTETLAMFAPAADLKIHCSGEAFLTAPGPDVDNLCAAILAVTGVTPKLDTGGGTSDARFITRVCPVAEFGLVGASMHQADECVPVAQLRQLTQIYRGIIAGFAA